MTRTRPITSELRPIPLTAAEGERPEHPQRCETCQHFEEHNCRFTGGRLANIEIVHIERVGCASWRGKV